LDVEKRHPTPEGTRIGAGNLQVVDQTCQEGFDVGFGQVGAREHMLHFGQDGLLFR
jgi:hypothetical protein